MTIPERIKKIRKEKGLTQQEFAEALNLKQNTIATYEIGRTLPSERTMVDICDKFQINPDWLSKGEGEMFKERTRNEQIAAFMTKALKDEDESFRKRLIDAMAAWDEKDWEDAERLALKLTKKS